MKKLSVLFFTLFAFSSSALAVCDLSNSSNINYKSLNRDGVAALSNPAQAVYSDAVCVAVGNYGCVTNTETQKIWLDRNLGASQVCTSTTDTECFGDYYQWGRNKDGHEKFNSGTSTSSISYETTDNSNFIIRVDWATDDGDGSGRSARWATADGGGVCPVGFRVPSAAELTAEYKSWKPSNIRGAFASPLKWPAAGYRVIDTGADPGRLSNDGRWAYIWSSTINTDTDRIGYLFFSGSSARIDDTLQRRGQSVRCVRG